MSTEENLIESQGSTPTDAEEQPDAAVHGFRFAAAASGMRFTGRDDLALIVADRPAAWAGVFTTSSAAGAPVLL
ncbi:MAG TPA: bifunctional ornithine acetyltransferase/N-acetylglutamate synthase, partial [Thermoanaerobaculia bacterium]|nr:bifunctional ornithine acetyltransferase/N-acetylglutamate synthase [Thermoanaerobaculia bacterium]